MTTAVQAPANTAVFASGVTRTFGDRAILRGLDISIAPGEFVALLGRSGTGKSTLLRILGGLDPDYGGEVLVPQRRAVVFQEPRLLPWQRVLPNVALGLTIGGPSERARLREQSLSALGEVGLASHARAWPVTLSGGEAQRVALARALVREPQLMLLDEPFGALDALTRARMHGLLQDLCARHHPAVLLVTHDVDEAILLADRVLVLSDGGDHHRPPGPAGPATGPRPRRVHRAKNATAHGTGRLGRVTAGRGTVGGGIGSGWTSRVQAARPVAFSTTRRTTTRTAPGRSSPGSRPSYFQESWVSNRRPSSGVIETRPRSST